MHFVIVGLDRTDAGDIRMNTRAEHREYLHGWHSRVQLRLAGPLLGLDGYPMIGSLIVVEAETRDAVDAFCAGDPYRRAGLVQEVTIRAWEWNTGKST